MKKDWEIKKLGDVCELITKGTTPTSIGFDFQANGINFVKIESFSEDGTIIENKVAHISKECHEALKRSQLQKGDILFSIAGALGRTAIIDESIIPANTNQALAIIRLQNKDITFIKFLLYYFKTDYILKQIEKDKGGVAQQNLSLKQIGDFEIKIPPLEEQKRIVKILDEKFAQLETIKANAQTNLQNAKDLFQSQLTKAFSNTTWEKKRLGEVCEIIGGTTPSTTNKSYWDGTEKWITPAEIDVKNKYIYDSVRHITKEAVKACSLKLQPKGTVIFTSRAPIGKVAIAEMDFYCNQGFKNFICSKQISNEYLYYFLINNVDYLNSIGKGTTFKEISKTVVSQVEILLPPLPEQKRIVKELDTLSEKVRQLQEIYTKQIANCDELKQSLLQKAFEGEL